MFTTKHRNKKALQVSTSPLLLPGYLSMGIHLYKNPNNSMFTSHNFKKILAAAHEEKGGGDDSNECSYL